MKTYTVVTSFFGADREPVLIPPEGGGERATIVG